MWDTHVLKILVFSFFFLTFCLLFKVGYLFYVFGDAVRVVVFVLFYACIWKYKGVF